MACRGRCMRRSRGDGSGRRTPSSQPARRQKLTVHGRCGVRCSRNTCMHAAWDEQAYDLSSSVIRQEKNLLSYLHLDKLKVRYQIVFVFFPVCQLLEHLQRFHKLTWASIQFWRKQEKLTSNCLTNQLGKIYLSTQKYTRVDPGWHRRGQARCESEKRNKE
jgi:hypothetical protein